MVDGGLVCAAVAALTISASPLPHEPKDLWHVGAAQVDITPPFPVPLNGYYARHKDPFFKQVAQRIAATCLVIGREHPAVLVAIDSCAIPGPWVDSLRARIAKELDTAPERIAMTCSHSHATPCLTGTVPNIFGRPFTEAEKKAIDRYTEWLGERIMEVVRQAAARRQPARLEWTVGSVGFAANRRPQGGPVDHSLPVLRAVDPNSGKPLAFLATYACHCTTTRAIPAIHGDWAGVAREELTKRWNAVALISIGCGADANPQPRGTIELAEQHGRALAAEVNRLMKEGNWRPLRPPLRCRLKKIKLPFGQLPTKEELERLAKQQTPAGNRARLQLERLRKEGRLPTHLPYTIQSWAFGDDLCMIFLAGEVVVDYAIRLRKELDAERIWIHAYANDVPCYIPSRRILAEGGYEADSSMIYFNQPTRLAPETEDILVDSVLSIVPPEFYGPENARRMPPPRTPVGTLRSIHVPPGFRVELAAAEPVIQSPVAIDFGPDGSLWVVEMYDYPTGIDEAWTPGGRVKKLMDRDNDGFYETATVFLEGIPFPTGILVWGSGAFVCAAPDILWAKDLDGDGRADRVRKLYSGFATHNYQARVNSLRLGLDSWIYGANGLFGGQIESPFFDHTVDLSGRDFRFNPETWAFEPVTGLSQHGRVRDDWGNWFGTTSTNLLAHYVYPQSLLRRAPYLAPRRPSIRLASADEQRRLRPASPPMERYNQPQHLYYVTSACCPTIFRSTTWGADYYGDAFVCEPVHNVVVRRKLVRQGVSFRFDRPDDAQYEFFAAEDPWCRPVEVRTGPDGCLWVVDMYRFVIEHPRWIPPHQLRRLDVRAGADRGRIYRIVRAGQRIDQRWRRLATADAKELAAALGSDIGPLRDMVHRELLSRGVRLNPHALADDGVEAHPAVRLHKAWVLSHQRQLPVELVREFANSGHPELRRNAARLIARCGDEAAKVRVLERLARDSDPSVRLAAAEALLTVGKGARLRIATQLLGGESNEYVRLATLANTIGELEELIRRFARDGGTVQPALLNDLAKAVRHNPQAAAAYVELLAELRNKRGVVAVMGALATAAPGIACNAAARDRVQGWLPELVEVAGDSRRAPSERVAALETLQALGSLEEELAASAAELVQSHLPRSVRRRAVVVAARAGEAVWERILERWDAVAVEQRMQLIERWLQTAAGRQWLEEKLISGRLQPSDLTASQRQRLLSAATDAALKAKLAQPASSTERRRLVERYLREAPRDGDAEKGRELFVKHCSACHRIGTIGREVGPNLAELTSRDRRSIFTAVLDPNAAVDPRYFSRQLLLKDGRLLVGLVEQESDRAIALTLPDGSTVHVLREEVELSRVVRQSLMPEGFEAYLSPEDLAHIFVYLEREWFGR